MPKLNKSEKQWIAEVQELLDRCPSKRLGFYTTGGSTVTVYDRTKDRKIDDIHNDRFTGEFCGAVTEAKANFDVWLEFPAAVHSTAG